MIATNTGVASRPTPVSTRRDFLWAFGGMVCAGTAAANLPYLAAARGKDTHKHHGTKSADKTVTQTFTNSAPITINTAGSATPFPSQIRVDGFKNATITDVDVILRGFSHRFPEEVDILLVSPDGRNALVMSDIGTTSGAKDLTIRLDDEAATDLPGDPVGLLASGSYRPTNITDSAAPDVFDVTYAPVPSGKVALTTFDGGDPNGQWRLFIRDDHSGDGGVLSGGWDLQITATTAASKKKEKKHKKKR